MLRKLKAAESGCKLHDSYCRKPILEFMHAMHATGHVCVHSYLTVIIATLRLAVQIPVIYSLPNWQKERSKNLV